MKINIDGILVVEGKEDVSYLSSFLNALFFTTNGLDISRDKIDFLKEAAKKNKIIVLTDNDEAGIKISNVIKNEINASFVIKTPQIARKNYIKRGVAETDKQVVLEALKPFITNTSPFNENYNLASLISLSDDPQAKREEIIKKYRLIYGDNKSISNQLKILKISKKELWK